MIKKDRMVRSSHMITISLMETGISVATTQGMVVENIKTWVILMTLMIKRVSSGAFTTTRTGRYISARPRKAALAASRGLFYSVPLPAKRPLSLCLL